MASSRVTVNMSKTIIVCHVCSTCGNPVVSLVDIKSEATRHYTLSQSHARKQAEDDAKNAIESEIKRIKTWTLGGKPLSRKVNVVSKFAYGHWCESEIENIDYDCPVCHQKEPWQRVLDTKKVGYKKKNLPSIYSDLDEADGWIEKNIEKKVSEIKTKQNDEELVSKSKTESIELYLFIQNLNKEIENIPEKVKSQKLHEERSLLIDQKSKIGLLDIKLKKAVDTKIKSLSEEIEITDKILFEKEDKLYSEISQKEFELLNNQSVAFGLSDEQIIKESQKTFAYYIKPLDIPKEEIDKFVASKNKQIDIKQNAVIEMASNEEPQIFFCRKCGFKLLPDSEFCSKCGVSIR